MISLKVESLTCWYPSMPRSRVYSEFSEIAPGGAFEQSRSGLPTTLPGLGRQWYLLAQWRFCNSSGTIGIVEPCVYHAFLRRLYSKPVAGGFAYDGMGHFVLYAQNRAGVDMVAFGDDWAHNIKPRVVCEVSCCAFFIRAIFPVSGMMVLYDGLECAHLSPMRDVAF